MASTLHVAFEFASQGDWARLVPAAREALSANPDDANAHALLALGLAHLKQPRDAVEAARRSVALDPELPFAQYALGWALLEHDDPRGAEQAARACLRLNPDPGSYALLGQILARQRRWQEALDMASRGLEIDADDVGCANVRAMALGALGRRREADEAVRGVLALDPDDAGSHTNRGWLLLRQGEPEEALECFRMALRLDPASEYARTGIVEALKARRGVYRLLLRHSLWLSTLSGRARWMFILGLYFGARLARGVMRDNPATVPVLGPLLGLYILYCIMTWISGPISNLLLRLNPFGRLVLSPPEILASNLIGGCLAVVGLALVLLGITRSEAWGIVAIASALLLIPIGGASNAYGSRAWRPLGAGALVLGGVAVSAAALAFVNIDGAAVALSLLFIGCFVFGWVANYLTIKYQ